jgi:hypothetical protein
MGLADRALQHPGRRISIEYIPCAVLQSSSVIAAWHLIRLPQRERAPAMALTLRAVAGSERRFVALCRARQRPAHPTVYHAVTPHCRPALCAAEPGAGSRWAEPPAQAVTCPDCLKRLDRLARAGAAVVIVGSGEHTIRMP